MRPKAERFSAGPGPTVLAVDGWRIALGVCKDTGVMQHVAGTAALGVDGYVAGLVHRPEELAEQEARAVVIARAAFGWATPGEASLGAQYPPTQTSGRPSG